MTGTQHARFLVRIWDLLAEPKSVTVMMTFAYGGLLGMGFWAIVDASPGGVRDMMGGLLIAGGVCGLIGCPWGQWWIERAGLVAIGAAFAVHLSFVVAISSPDGPWEVASALGLLLLVVTRWIRIRTLPADPMLPRPRPPEVGDE
ncbi:hypothetical protein FAM19024_001850 [Propionibacterium freudenreichii]|uniref:hypothetical protein n=1 Tax=Propionibacterium freudenreichii TaxID=1744 RepID=UPI0024342DF7|nr:hypothetical protein [Propionibacterium freudenreichii]WFF32389.1 hypothetical protein FAM19024_001850 [Propionibacterium freudenreichii]